MNIDHELRDALRHKEAPADLADRVLQRINETPAHGPAPSLSGVDRGVHLRQGSRAYARVQGGMRRSLAAAAVLAISAGGAGRYYTQQRQAAETARVQEEIRIALQITNDTLTRLQTKLSPPADDSR